MRFIAIGLFFLGSVVGGGAAAQDWFSDDFNDGVIAPAHWRSGGAINESGGVLNLLRQEPADSLATISSYSGDFRVELDSRLDAIVWNDMFHGIAIMNSAGAGISFGYSMYTALYLAISDGSYTSYQYANAGTNQPGTWQHWTLEKQGNQVTVFLGGTPVFGPVGPVPEACRILLPGIYSDGDGGPHVGYTVSTVDNFSIQPLTSSVPEQPGPEVRPVTWGALKRGYSAR